VIVGEQARAYLGHPVGGYLARAQRRGGRGVVGVADRGQSAAMRRVIVGSGLQLTADHAQSVQCDPEVESVLDGESPV
jgi:hypothetical protein